jgi:hypothetical protein
MLWRRRNSSLPAFPPSPLLPSKRCTLRPLKRSRGLVIVAHCKMRNAQSGAPDQYPPQKSIAVLESKRKQKHICHLYMATTQRYRNDAPQESKPQKKKKNRKPTDKRRVLCHVTQTSRDTPLPVSAQTPLLQLARRCRRSRCGRVHLCRPSFLFSAHDSSSEGRCF